MKRESTRPWISLVANVWHDPKLYTLDAEGMAVWIWMLCTAKLDHLDGGLPSEYLAPEFVASSCRMSVESAGTSIKQIIKTGVVTEQEDGSILINNWGKYQKSPSDSRSSVAERVRRHREKAMDSNDMAEVGQEGNADVTAVTECNGCNANVTDVTAVTSCNGCNGCNDRQDRTGQDRTGQLRKNVPLRNVVEHSPPASESGGDSDLPKQIFEFWTKTMGKAKQTRLTEERRRKIKARLKNYTPHDIGLAITGCRHSAYHMGDNDEGRRYDDIELICRNDTNLEKFRDLGIQAKKIRGSPPQIGGTKAKTPDSSVSAEEAFKRLEQDDGQGNE